VSAVWRILCAFPYVSRSNCAETRHSRGN